MRILFLISLTVLSTSWAQASCELQSDSELQHRIINASDLESWRAAVYHFANHCQTDACLGITFNLTEGNASNPVSEVRAAITSDGAEVEGLVFSFAIKHRPMASHEKAQEQGERLPYLTSRFLYPAEGKLMYFGRPRFSFFAELPPLLRPLKYTKAEPIDGMEPTPVILSAADEASFAEGRHKIIAESPGQDFFLSVTNGTRQICSSKKTRVQKPSADGAEGSTLDILCLKLSRNNPTLRIKARMSSALDEGIYRFQCNQDGSYKITGLHSDLLDQLQAEAVLLQGFDALRPAMTEAERKQLDADSYFFISEAYAGILNSVTFTLNEGLSGSEHIVEGLARILKRGSNIRYLNIEGPLSSAKLINLAKHVANLRAKEHPTTLVLQPESAQCLNAIGESLKNDKMKIFSKIIVTVSSAAEKTSLTTASPENPALAIILKKRLTPCNAH